MNQLINEIWKDIPGFEGSYQVSNLGRIKSFPKLKKSRCGASSYFTKERIRSFNGTRHYPILDMYRGDGTCEYISIHRLVAKLFIPNPDSLPFVNHKDMNKYNNHVDNLEWSSNRENVSHGNIIRLNKPIGVSWKSSINKWVSVIMVGKKQKYLGSFSDQGQAALAYKNALKEFNINNKYASL